MKKPALIVSACLMGVNCRYDGTNRALNTIEELEKYFELIPVCPETDGGMSVPRPPSELTRGKAKTSDGKDVTAFYERGARMAVEKAVACGAKYALLKDCSPSCGTTLIYDGTFTGNKISGEGVTARALEKAGLICFSETQVQELLQLVEN